MTTSLFDNIFRSPPAIPVPPPSATAVAADRARRMTIEERFEQFDQQNPEVYREFVKLAERLMANGRTHYSSDALLHVVRFHRAIETRGDEPFKINNDFSSRFARKLAASDPRFRDFFEFRTLKSA